LVDSSPRPIAASHVLHRLLVPRHPPFALDNLTTKMLASTMQISTNNQPTTPHPTPAPQTMADVPSKPRLANPRNQTHTQRLVPSGPNRMLEPNPDQPHQPPTFHHNPPTGEPRLLTEDQPLPARPFTSVSANEHPTTTSGQRGLLPPLRVKALLRKEVIQPHLPVRLPCYDFVPIASPTFDSSLPQGVGPPASGVADFRDVTGGVYKARERIHRSVADLRLLATPTSRGRVADPDPN